MLQHANQGKRKKNCLRLNNGYADLYNSYMTQRADVLKNYSHETDSANPFTQIV